MQYDIRRLDVYRKIPKDLTEPTYTGAFISIFSCLFIAFLFFSELSSFLTVEIVSDMYVTNPVDDLGERIPVQIDITVAMDCQFVGLDIQDDMGRHEVGFVENVDKQPSNEGAACRFKAKFKVNKVPGNFHLSTHSSRVQPNDPDMTHTVHELIFGDNVSEHVYLPGGSFNSLANRSPLKTNALNTHDYVLKVVPTLVEDVGGKKTFNTYQYTFAYREYMQVGHGHSIMPAIWFRYDLSPITVRYIEKRKPFYSFLTTVCAIVGGTFTVAGIIDSLIFTASSIFKKAELGKLS